MKINDSMHELSQVLEKMKQKGMTFIIAIADKDSSFILTEGQICYKTYLSAAIQMNIQSEIQKLAAPQH